MEWFIKNASSFWRTLTTIFFHWVLAWHTLVTNLTWHTLLMTERLLILHSAELIALGTFFYYSGLNRSFAKDVRTTLKLALVLLCIKLFGIFLTLFLIIYFVWFRTIQWLQITYVLWWGLSIFCIFLSQFLFLFLFVEYLQDRSEHQIGRIIIEDEFNKIVEDFRQTIHIRIWWIYDNLVFTKLFNERRIK